MYPFKFRIILNCSSKVLNLDSYPPNIMTRLEKILLIHILVNKIVLNWHVKFFYSKFHYIENCFIIIF